MRDSLLLNVLLLLGVPMPAVKDWQLEGLELAKQDTVDTHVVAKQDTYVVEKQDTHIREKQDTRVVAKQDTHVVTESSDLNKL